MKKIGIILDVDGTLWDSTDGVAASWEACRRAHIPEMAQAITGETVRSVFGKTMAEIRDILLPFLPMPRRESVMQEMMSYEVEYLDRYGAKPYPGVEETMRALSGEGYRLFIVSNCQKGYIETFLKWSDTADIVTDHICFEDTHRPKNESIELCIRRNAIERPVYVGDIQADLTAAKKAGSEFIYASYGFGDIDCEKEGVESLGSFSELPEAIHVLEARNP